MGEINAEMLETMCMEINRINLYHLEPINKR